MIRAASESCRSRPDPWVAVSMAASSAKSTVLASSRLRMISSGSGSPLGTVGRTSSPRPQPLPMPGAFAGASHLARVLQEQLQQRKLSAGEMERTIAPLGLVGYRVQREVAEAQHLALGRPPAQEGAQAGEK